MLHFEDQRNTLRKLVAMAESVQKDEFYYTCNSMGDHVNFEVGDGVAHTFDRGRLSEVMPSEYVMPTSRCRAFITELAFDAVERGFAPPAEPPPPAPAQHNYLINSGTIGAVTQLNISTASRHAASDALDQLRTLLTGLPPHVADEVGAQVEAIDAEVHSGTPVEAKLKASFGLAAMLLKDYGPATAALIQAAHAVGLDVWVKSLFGSG